MTSHPGLINKTKARIPDTDMFLISAMSETCSLRNHVKRSDIKVKATARPTPIIVEPEFALRELNSFRDLKSKKAAIRINTAATQDRVEKTSEKLPPPLIHRSDKLERI